MCSGERLLSGASGLGRWTELCEITAARSQSESHQCVCSVHDTLSLMCLHISTGGLSDRATEVSGMLALHVPLTHKRGECAADVFLSVRSCGSTARRGSVERAESSRAVSWTLELQESSRCG